MTLEEIQKRKAASDRRRLALLAINESLARKLGTREKIP